MHPEMLRTAVARCLLALSLIPFAATAAEHEAGNETKEAKEQEEPEAQSSVTRHSIVIDGKPVAYTATAGWLILDNDEGEPIARFGYTAYTRDGVEDRSQRPIMFAFNGGPGTSVDYWLRADLRVSHEQFLQELKRDETYQIMGGVRDWDWEHRPPDSRGWAVPWANLRGDLASFVRDTDQLD